jgi:hypothetical protein
VGPVALASVFCLRTIDAPELSRIPDPQFVPQLGQNALEAARVPGSFDPHPRRR